MVERMKKSPIAENEEKTLQFWKDNSIFKKSLEKLAPKGDFIFYEGPPTANGRPGIHHLEARAFKDVIPRYKTMQGFRVERKAGWDTHGLPVELEVEKQLKLTSKKEIEEYGIARFNEECKKSVWKYVDEWKEFTERMGYWVDMDNPYVTYYPEYIESVWNIISEIWKKNLLYKDYKVVPWCPRCGTGLSSHELAQPGAYIDVKDLSVIAKFKLLEDSPSTSSGQANTFILAWTTTPWTLPGNVALAVGEDIDYVEVSVASNEKFILAKNRLSIISEEYKIVREMKGRDLIGFKYEPLYHYLKENISEKEKDKLGKAFKVYSASFVTTEDGTGVVHTAVMYGQDDFELGTKIGLPKQHLVGEDGKFLKGTGIFQGRFVKDEDVAVDIIKDLAHRGLLFKKEKYEHPYPHCWRCDTPLIYYARDSWYIKMSEVRDALIEENKSINWEPENIRDGRFGEWLKDVKDWAISRERYWGTPLPIWSSEDGSEVLAIDSLSTLKAKTKTNGNTFLFIRHGEAESNAQNIATSDPDSKYGLTEKGKKQSEEIVKQLLEKKVSAVYSSPFLRTKQTANIIADVLSISKVIEDERIMEYNFGDFSGKPFAEYLAYEAKHMDAYDTAILGGESYLDAKKRFGDFIYDIDTKHKGETIAVVTHGIGGEVVSAIVEGANMNRSKEIIDTLEFKNGSILEFKFVPLPHNENYELDLHRPYIDEVVLIGDSGKELKRVKEVMDVWLDSGTMPFSQYHYPFAFGDGKGADNNKLPYPADYISEAIDQTRGWFYTLHAIGVLLGRGKAYKNVICLGHILDDKGQKMSKSKGNVVNPWEMIDKYGVDALRFWMYSVNQPGDSKNFDERTVDEVVKKVFNLLLNVRSFYELYAENRTEFSRSDSSNVLDQWILFYLDDVTLKVTNSLDSFDIFTAARLIRDFIADLSQWYVRRSRDRFKGDDSEDRKNATNTLGFVLERLSLVLAPFMPFLAEDLYQKLRMAESPVSVHLVSWPEVDTSSVGEVIPLSFMKEVRRLVSLGLEARARAGIKVRQPLSTLKIKSDILRGADEYIFLIKEEVNVKDVIFDSDLSEEVFLQTEITEELKKEGGARELIRTIQEKRKEKGLFPKDLIVVSVFVNEWGRDVVVSFKGEIVKTCGISDLKVVPSSEADESWFSVEF